MIYFILFYLGFLINIFHLNLFLYFQHVNLFAWSFCSSNWNWIEAAHYFCNQAGLTSSMISTIKFIYSSFSSPSPATTTTQNTTKNWWKCCLILSYKTNFVKLWWCIKAYYVKWIKLFFCPLSKYFQIKK